VKDFVLVRGPSGMLYLYETKMWEFMLKSRNAHGYEFVTDNDDPKVLRQMQALVNKDIEVNS
jgi:hypothetical protein